jgi:hypothetical protein
MAVSIVTLRLHEVPNTSGFALAFYSGDPPFELRQRYALSLLTSVRHRIIRRYDI